MLIIWSIHTTFMRNVEEDEHSLEDGSHMNTSATGWNDEEVGGRLMGFGDPAITYTGSTTVPTTRDRQAFGNSSNRNPAIRSHFSLL
ncbi:hypothetical protein COOONC_16204 [Cooperia oncophora]